MATAYIYNGFGQYEQRNGELGITLFYAGVPFWLAFEKVTPIPNFTLREVDHDKTTPQGDVAGELVYQNVIVNGLRVAEELCDKQVPVSFKECGCRAITGKPTGNTVVVVAGWDSEGSVLTAEVPERAATETEKSECANAAKQYKERIIGDYFQSKRERMTGGHGRLHPDAQTRRYMEELNIEDIDDPTARQKGGSLGPDSLKAIVRAAMEGAGEVNAEMIAEIIQELRHPKLVKLPNDEEQARRKAFGERMAAAKAAKAAERETVTEGA